MGRFQQLLIRDRREWEAKDKQSREALGKVLFPHHRMHTTISLSYFRDSETPSR